MFLFFIFHCILFEVWGTPSLGMDPGCMGRVAAGGDGWPCLLMGEQQGK